MRRDGEFFLTYTGVQFWPLAPRIEDINIEDIAHGLAHTCRWGGHAREFYSVAQHSIVCSHHVAPEHRMIALMHDAAEAYIGDVKRPLKYAIPAIRQIEDNIYRLIAQKFGLPYDIPREVKIVDDRVLLGERDEFITYDKSTPWPIDRLGLEPIPPFEVGNVFVMAPVAAKAWFLDRFNTLKTQLEFTY